MRSAVKREAPLRLQSRPRPRRRAVPLKTLYTASDLAGVAHLNSMPGAAPFVRGPYASMYTAKPWTIRQYAGYAEAADSNLAFRTALAEGAQGLSVAFDLPTQRGYDSDDPRGSAEVGLAGVAIDTVEDMARLFAGIPLDRTSVSMTMNGAVLPVLAAFIVAAEERGVAAAQLTGTIQNDILKEFIVRNTCIFAPEPSLRIAADVVDYLARHAPRFNALSVSGYHFQEAGADPVLELALTMAHARTYIETLGARGMNADDACERMSFFFGVGTDFYVEVAKLRAARLVWSELAMQCGAASDKARALRMHCQTSGWSLTAQKPSNNIVRTTVEALAAVFGGTQSLHTNAFDEALALPSASSSRLARDTQLMLQHEMGLCDVVDPWAGSYMMEALTADIAARVRSLIGEIDARGGVVQAIRSGWIRQRIQAASGCDAQSAGSRSSAASVCASMSIQHATTMRPSIDTGAPARWACTPIRRNSRSMLQNVTPINWRAPRRAAHSTAAASIGRTDQARLPASAPSSGVAAKRDSSQTWAERGAGCSSASRCGNTSCNR